ncbi:MAG TPA: hypothetical protein VFU81_11455 [Thermomicrobiales bacterium]|nr:hypothetical protein [Thermomicrobiales bacterium]
MRWLHIALACLAASASLLAPAVSLAQDATPPATPAAGLYLPAAADLGAGWVEIWRGDIAPGPELFKDGVKAVYGGPAGARAIVFAWVTLDSATVVRRSWEATTEIFDDYRLEFANDYDRAAAKDLAALPPPAGCAEASRAEGAASKQQFPGGLTLCAVDPDVIVLAIVSGTLDGKQGRLASDALVERALGRRPAATPTG